MANIAFAKKNKTNFHMAKKIYNILIVDDDHAIHEVTNIALTSMNFSDFKLNIFNAYSAEEAKEILHKEPNIAMAMVDVVMETSEAGLELVNYIRNDLQNRTIRLIIRTGQANEHPQMQVIQHYDINDFKEKTELTSERLYTVIRTSIKQYGQLIELQDKYKDTYRQMTTNALTHLPNRNKLIDDFSKNSHKTLVLIDIIGFSIINDTNGYDVGDYVLQELGGFLTSMYSSSFNIYHVHNDIFALVSKDENLDNLVEIVEGIKDDISKLKIITNSFNKSIETTIGVAHQTEDDIMKKAELALKEARYDGRNQIKFYSNDLKIIQRINDTNHWAPIIKDAIENNNIMAYAQPIYNISDNSIDKYELLVRLNHQGTILYPAQFLSAAENSGQLYNIFKFMFEQACEHASESKNRYSINISDAEFLNEGLYEFITTTIARHKVDPTLLALEILEYNAISNSQDIKDMIIKINNLGIEFIVDDFGVQCSNFGQIENLPITTLKIDGSFIKNIHESVNSQIIVKTIQTFAQEKGLKIIAEFVTNETVYKKVKELGIEFAQGYYFAEPSLLQ